MKAICVDDERLLMEDAVSMLKSLNVFDEVTGFVRSDEALNYLDQLKLHQ